MLNCDANTTAVERVVVENERRNSSTVDPQEVRSFLGQLVRGDARKPGTIINMLNALEERYRHIPVEAACELSRMLGISFADICSLITSFESFDFDAPGRYMILVCDGTACHTRGSVDLIKALEDALGVDCGGTSEDGLYTLKAVYCVGMCSLAPVVQIDTETFGRVRLNEIDHLLDSYARVESSEDGPVEP